MSSVDDPLAIGNAELTGAHPEDESDTEKLKSRPRKRRGEDGAARSRANAPAKKRAGPLPTAAAPDEIQGEVQPDETVPPPPAQERPRTLREIFDVRASADDAPRRKRAATTHFLRV